MATTKDEQERSGLLLGVEPLGRVRHRHELSFAGDDKAGDDKKDDSGDDAGKDDAGDDSGRDDSGDDSKDDGGSDDSGDDR
jgi:hypothetical protein